ncbi:hypothetical protein [Paenisporosarcina indica]|uniref:hypothetical protein n=1 Tax=Paenisporosarcina indica TaxID=650093 RepID=UPI00094FD21F|nr:hypothetical protein [Paenisporosarcina indica]
MALFDTDHRSDHLDLEDRITGGYNFTIERDFTEPELYSQLIKRTVPLGNFPKIVGYLFT